MQSDDNENGPEVRPWVQSDDFLDGHDLGEATARLRIYYEVQKAYSSGTLEEWLDRERPKTVEEWQAWETEHGEL